MSGQLATVQLGNRYFSVTGALRASRGTYDPPQPLIRSRHRRLSLRRRHSHPAGRYKLAGLEDASPHDSFVNGSLAALAALLSSSTTAYSRCWPGWPSIGCSGRSRSALTPRCPSRARPEGAMARALGCVSGACVKTGPFFCFFVFLRVCLLNKPTVPKNGTHHTVAVIKTTTRNFGIRKLPVWLRRVYEW